MLVHIPEHNVDYAYYFIMKPNDNSSFAVCIDQMINEYLQNNINVLSYSIKSELVYDGVMPYLNVVHNELSGSIIEFFDDKNCIIKHRNVYSWITWTFKNDELNFIVILGTNYTNTDLGIYVYGIEDDEVTIKNSNEELDDFPIETPTNNNRTTIVISRCSIYHILILALVFVMLLYNI